jgi:hypothetical protein
MKKINLTLLVLIIGLSGIAQYKKASYFGKDGRIYGLGTHFYALGSEYSGTHMGYTLSVSIDREGKQLFTGWEFQYLPGYGTAIGKTDGSFFYSYNFGYFLLKNENAEQKIKPYLAAALTGSLLGGVKESSVYDDSDAPRFGFGIGGGAGLFYYLKPWLGLQAEGGYTYQFAKKDIYNVLPKHPYASIGVRFRIVSN